MTGTVTVLGDANGCVSHATIEATIIRADGTVEHLGVIADSAPPQRSSFLQRTRAKLWRQ